MKGSPKNGRREACPEGGKSDYELAAEMGISQGRVLQLRQRAMKKMRQAIMEDPELIELVAELFGVHPDKLKSW